MSVLAVVIARLLFWLDSLLPNLPPDTLPLFFGGSPDTARSVLLAMAGTILATTGVVFSLLTVPLSVAASQFGSRLLRVYMRDRTTQIVLGMFAGTFTYCLVLGLFIPPAEFNPETPQISVTIGLLLSLIAFASLIALIHHIGVSLQAPNMVAAASDELWQVIHSAIPLWDLQQQVHIPDSPAGGKQPEAALISKIEKDGVPVYADNLGYIQDIDPALIKPLASISDLVVKFVRKPGHFVHPGELIAKVYPSDKVGEDMLQQIRDAYRLGNSRSPAQDIEYGVNQLAEVAIRAMSPAINDPFTAITCLDHLGAGLAFYASHVKRHSYFYDSHNQLRLIFDPTTFGDLLQAAFNMLRRASRENAEVLLSLLNAIDTIASDASLPEQRTQLALHVRLVEAECQSGNAIPWDKERVSRKCAELLAKLE